MMFRTFENVAIFLFSAGPVYKRKISEGPECFLKLRIAFLAIKNLLKRPVVECLKIVSFLEKRFLESLRVFSAFQYPGNTHHPLPRTSGASPGSGVTGTTCRCYFGLLWKVENFEFDSQKCPKHGSDWYLAEKGHRTLPDPEKPYIHTQQVLTVDRRLNLCEKCAV